MSLINKRTKACEPDCLASVISKREDSSSDFLHEVQVPSSSSETSVPTDGKMCTNLQTKMPYKMFIEK